MTRHESPQGTSTARVLLNKVPEVTVFFWIIKILATTVGETAADFLSDNVGPRPGRHDARDDACVFVVVLAVQFRTRRYVPGVYWLTVVLISVVGTLLTDNLTDALGVPLRLSTVGVRRRPGRHLRRLVPRRSGRCRSTASSPGRREAFYWLAILFTFALGTAAGDLVDEQFGVGLLADRAARRR